LTNRETYFVDVIVPLSIPNKYTYRVPAEYNELLCEGKRVLVQFGKSKIYTGVIYQIHQKAPEGYQAKYIEAVLDDFPVVEHWQLKFWDWLTYYYCANPGDVLNAALPSGLKLSSQSHIQINPSFNFEEIDHDYFTDREHQVIELLHANPNVSMDELASFLKVKSVHSIVSKLLKKNAVEVYEEVKDKYKPKRIAFVGLTETYHSQTSMSDLMNGLEKKAFKQAEVMLLFLQLSKAHINEWVKKTDLTKRVDSSAVNALIKKGVLHEMEMEVDRLIFEKSKHVSKTLNAEQAEVLQQIKKSFETHKPVLLHGATGSGKTEVYIKLIEEVVSKGFQVLYLVPEIALTTQLIIRLRAVFGEKVGVYHSRFSENERVEIWNNVLGAHRSSENSNTYQIILGARSSLFLPLSQLGLIIVDEEHDFSFKQQSPAPRYHARDAAIYLAAQRKANILLGSATPTLESYFNARSQKYELAELKHPFTDTGAVELEICDIKQYEAQQNMKGVLTPPLYAAIQNALSLKQQVILFQNRRGFAPYTQCNACGTVPYCKNCDVPMIYHKYLDKLVCHYCGYNSLVPKTCAACGKTDLRFKGLGTEKIEEDIELLFPDARIARMDLDTTRSKHAHKQLIDDFTQGGIDILIGTQMVTKGLDFENVSIVGILNVDSILNFPDFRSHERAYQLITQLKGRAGRKNHRGKLFIQTTLPSHPILKAVQENEIHSFYQHQLKEREQYNYPPFCRLIELTVISSNQDELNHLSQLLANDVKKSGVGEVLGPEFPLIPRIKNNYYKRILLKVAKQNSLQQVRKTLFDINNDLYSQHRKWRFVVQVNVDP
jgi:primosomal protein N' (replication factor Y) (superfamily II helicase)